MTTPTTSPVLTWTTLALRPAPRPAGDRATGAEPGSARIAPDPIALESLAGLLALDPDVSGVQQHDTGTWDERTEPSLTVYTAPEAAEDLIRRARELAANLGLGVEVERHDHAGDAHLDAWRAFHRPAIYAGPSGPRLLVRPTWHARDPDDPPLEVVLDPGRAFGTGRHESTRLCLEWLCAQTPAEGPRVLDLGCGSGILGLAAARLFGAEVLAVDTDPEATATTAENAADNALAITTHTGDLASTPPGTFDLILANIRPEVLLPMAAALVQRLAPGGAMVLSGILIEEAPAVTRAYTSAGARVTPAGTLEGWTALEVRRDGGEG